MQFALGASAIKEAVGLLADVVEDPDTYKRIDGLRSFIAKVTGVEIDQNGFVALLEGVTQGEVYTGKWEVLDEESGARRMRWRDNPGWIFQAGHGTNPIFVSDK